MRITWLGSTLPGPHNTSPWQTLGARLGNQHLYKFPRCFWDTLILNSAGLEGPFQLEGPGPLSLAQHTC